MTQLLTNGKILTEKFYLQAKDFSNTTRIEAAANIILDVIYNNSRDFRKAEASANELHNQFMNALKNRFDANGKKPSLSQPSDNIIIKGN